MWGVYIYGHNSHSKLCPAQYGQMTQEYRCVLPYNSFDVNSPGIYFKS